MAELLSPQCADNSAKTTKINSSTSDLSHDVFFLRSEIPAETSCVAACTATAESFTPTTVHAAQKTTISHQQPTTVTNPKNRTCCVSGAVERAPFFLK